MSFKFLIFSFTLSLAMASCPIGMIPGINSNFCYLLVTTPKTWTAAEYDCHVNGGDLASISNAFQNDLLLGGASEGLTTDSYWIGGSNILLSDGKLVWTWSDLANFTYANWASGQPQNSASACIAPKISTSGKWYSDDCFTAKPYVCELPQGTTINPNTTCNNTVSSKCPTGWTYFAYMEKCYKFITAFPSTYLFDAARAACKNSNINADLASIHDFNENTILSALSLNQIDALQENSNEGCGSGDVINDCCVFIGLYSNSSSNWRWTDGSSYDFNYWQGNQPPTAGNAIIYVGTTGQNFWSMVLGNCENALCEMKPLN